jgi:hypothetical protein
VSVGALLLAISLGPTEGWLSPVFLILIAVAVVVGALWVSSAVKSTEPLIDLTMLRSRRISASIAAGGLVAGTGSLFLIVSALVGQTPYSVRLGYGFGLSGANYAYVQTFYFLGFLLGGVIAVRALRRTSYVNVVLGGLAVLAASALVGLLGVHQVVVFGVVHLTIGIVIGLFFSANFNFIFSMVSVDRRASAGSLYLTATTVGQSLLSVLPLSLAAVIFPAVASGSIMLPTINFYLYFVVGVALLAAVFALVARRADRHRSADVDMPRSGN